METTYANGTAPLNGKSWLFRIGVACMASLSLAGISFAESITLSWDPETAPDMAGYRLYYSASPTAPFSGSTAAEGASPINVSTTTATLTGLDPNVPHYFTVTAYNTAGVESPTSNVITVAELVPPSVSITSPRCNSAVTGAVTIVAGASDNMEVTLVEFYVNDVLKATASEAPYFYSWDTSSVPPGIYTISAKAYDPSGNVGTDQVSVQVANDTTPPSASVSSPDNGSVLHGTVEIATNTTDDIGVAKVEFFINDALISAGNLPPYSYNWDTTGVANGAYTLYSKAYDAAGNVGESLAVEVYVLNDNVPPMVTISQTGSTTASGMITVAANASDNVGLAKVEFFVNGTLQATSTNAPYNFTWNISAVAAGTYTVTANAYDVAGNISQSPAITVNVGNITATDTTAPTVTILAPTSSYIYSSSVNVNASATDNISVTKLELYIDNALKYTTTSSFLDIKSNIPKGVHTITVKAYDAANNVNVASKKVNRFL